MELFVVIISWLLFGGVSSYFAAKRGRDPFAWFMIGMLLGILGLLLLFLLPPLAEKPKEGETETAAPVPEPSEIREPGRLNEWFYLDTTRNQIGPIPFHQLKKAWGEGIINPETLVWSQGLPDWKKVAELPSLRDLLS